MKLVSPQGMFQNFSGLLEPLPPPPGLQAASRATAAALTPAPSRLRLVKPDPEGRNAIVGVLSDARLHRPVRRRSSLNCCASRRPWWGTVSGGQRQFVVGPDDCQRGSAPYVQCRARGSRRPLAPSSLRDSTAATRRESATDRPTLEVTATATRPCSRIGVSGGTSSAFASPMAPCRKSRLTACTQRLVASRTYRRALGTLVPPVFKRL